eukprot:CAMPEP_0119070842 /NCGR_PEP_ID=MMETSP1178-20130426/43502_1 /TAXON_ID=33656 /ORGANISM="unid sp, Strain CCMP2000" /LENGTH=42 /DNA_ID= /DNA_START= /DNA_END= /DNA_ORIENTATION=
MATENPSVLHLVRLVLLTPLLLVLALLLGGGVLVLLVLGDQV